MVSWSRVDVLVDRVGRDVADEQRVAVGRRLRRRLERDVAVRAGPVLDHEALAERLGELLRDDARDDVGGAARAVGHEDPHRLRSDSCPAPRRPQRRAMQNSSCGEASSSSSSRAIIADAHRSTSTPTGIRRNGSRSSRRTARRRAPASSAATASIILQGQEHHQRASTSASSWSTSESKAMDKRQHRRPRALAHHADGLLGVAGLRPGAQPGVQRRGCRGASKASRSGWSASRWCRCKRPSSRVKELERAAKLPGMKGMYLATNVNGEELDEKQVLGRLRQVRGARLDRSSCIRSTPSARTARRSTT